MSESTLRHPDPKQPTPALIEAAYVAQDDLSKPPDQGAIDAAAEVIQAYIDAQGHTKVHVLGHPESSRAAPCESSHELAETLASELFERGQHVEDWPDDEKSLHRDSEQWTDFTDRANKVRELRFEKAADALLAAGWSKRRTVDSVEAAESLPKGSVIFCRGKLVAVADIEAGIPIWWVTGNPVSVYTDPAWFPAILLITPEGE